MKVVMCLYCSIIKSMIIYTSMCNMNWLILMAVCYFIVRVSQLNQSVVDQHMTLFQLGIIIKLLETVLYVFLVQI